MIKPIKVELTDENLGEILKQQQEQKFKEGLESLELKYCVENLERYAKYLNENINFPIKISFTIDNGMFGKEKITIQINEILENEVKQGLKCVYKTANGKLNKISLHKLELNKKDINWKLLEHFKKWYKKNH